MAKKPNYNFEKRQKELAKKKKKEEKMQARLERRGQPEEVDQDPEETAEKSD